MADNYDFTIDNLSFRLAERKDLPYIRSTAPFRKEQLDTSATVGDQSLTGWWTRGQLSFHMGAGLKYYEVLEGETVLNRFNESSNAKTFTLGEASLDVTPSVLLSSVELDAIASYETTALVYSTGFDAYYLSAPGATPQAIVPNDTTTPKFVTTLGEYIYVSTFGKKIEEFYQEAYVDTVYSHTQTIHGLWGGKDRLWIIDTLGDLYVKPVMPVSPPEALASPITRVNYVSGEPVCWTDAGGAVFMSVGSEVIYSFTPSSDGSIATLSAPVIAAILPKHERVKSIRAHMGLLCIVTNKGTRFASIDGDSLTVGPLSVKWTDSDCRSIGVREDSVFVIGNDDNAYDSYGYEFSLREPLPGNQLMFPYRAAWYYDTGAMEYVPLSFAHEHSTDGVAWASGGWTADTFETTAGQTTLQATGNIITAYHRFGTLDTKRFLKITVRAKGTGTIQVYQVDADGTETSLGTMNASAGVTTFDVAETNAVERMAFKFVLGRDSGDSTAGPTLLGYQIKALPVPERHRLLRVPLVIADFVSLKHGTRVGTQGKGYADIAALEELENSQAIVTYTDHRTGETGTAYIDSVEFQDNQPATYNDNGFGGFAYVTLRVIE